MVELLLEHGADLDAPCNSSKTALHYAAEVGVSAAVMGCLTAKACADEPEEGGDDGGRAQPPAAQRRDGRNRTPLHYAASQGNWANVKLLLNVRTAAQLPVLTPPPFPRGV